jgi:signal transduction histidine kinase
MVFPLRGADGVFRPFLTRIVPLFDHDGRIVRWFGTNTDIADQRRTEEALRASEQQLKHAQQIGNVGSWEWDIQTGSLWWSEQVYRQLGEDPAVFTPTHDAFLRRLHPEDRAAFEEASHHALAGTHSYDLELRMLRSDGTTCVLHTRGEVLRGPDGQPRSVLGVCLDITERKRAEEALAQRVQELARSNADLEQFAYVASHDLKEPLRAVSGCVGLLKRHYEGNLDERAGEYMAHVVDGAARMESLIDGLLAYSRVGARGGEFEAVECAQVLGRALQNLAAPLQETGAVVTQDSLPAVHGDAPQLVSLFQNLIGNSLKFRQEAPPRIHVGAERDGAHWHFSVRDNGIGIAPQYFERIFRLFCRLHTRIEYPGTGIGLALCKKIVERHGGRIWVESVPGEGATFYFSLLDAQTNHRQHGGGFHA